MALISNGTTIFDAGSVASSFKGSMTLIKKLTASSDATLSFVNGASNVVFDSTYKEYVFTFNNIHPSTASNFVFQGNAAGGSGFDETMTTTFFYNYHKESGTDNALMYNTGKDQAQGTAYTIIAADGVGTDNDNCVSGYLHLFNPSSTTFVTHFISRISNTNGGGSSTYECDCFSAGYFNTTAAIDEISFKFGSGNVDSGDICLYGIS